MHSHKSKINKDLLVGGSGWISAGVIAIATWLAEINSVVCNCPDIPANATQQQISQICGACGSNPIGLLVIGIAVIVVGASLLVFNKKIGRVVMRIGQ